MNEGARTWECMGVVEDPLNRGLYCENLLVDVVGDSMGGEDEGAWYELDVRGGVLVLVKLKLMVPM